MNDWIESIEHDKENDKIIVMVRNRRWSLDLVSIGVHDDDAPEDMQFRFNAERVE